MTTQLTAYSAPRALNDQEIDCVSGGSYTSPSESTFRTSSGPDWLTIITWCNAAGCGYFIP
jgi:hypothetical protein